MNETTRNLAEHLKDFLRGMRSVRAEDMPRLAEYPDWRRLAEREMERRACTIIEVLDDTLVASIANGTLNLPAAIRDVLNEP